MDHEKTPFTIAVDLDGTLAEQEKPFNPKTVGRPRPKAKKWMEAFRGEGARLIVNTVRGDTKLVKDWLTEHKIPFDYINENPDQPPDSSGKIFAHCYWDDRAHNAKDLDEHGPKILAETKAHKAKKEAAEQSIVRDDDIDWEAVAKFAEGMELPVPHHRQEKPYTCGPAALQELVKFFGKKTDEESLVQEAGTTKSKGTPPEKLVAAARQEGLPAKAYQHMTAADLLRSIQNGKPVIVDYQDWGKPNQYRKDESGHYSVVTGIQGGKVVLSDPATDKSRRKIDLCEFLQRWHDETADGRKTNHLGIVVDPKSNI